MLELTREEKLKMIEKLPQKLQDFLYSEDLGAFLFYLENKYKLPEDKISALAGIIAGIILGITPITSLAQEINSKITSDAQTAMNMAHELNTELLAPAFGAKELGPAQQKAISGHGDDKYREPTTEVPKIVDLRKAPAPAPTPTPAPKPTPPAPPLIEAEPHKVPTPQYIMKPSGAPPTDRPNNVPDNVLDLRKDKGEF